MNNNTDTYDSIEELDAAAYAAYDGEFGARMAWFQARSTEELTALWRRCMMTPANPWGEAYDDEVYETLHDRGFDFAAFRKAFAAEYEAAHPAPFDEITADERRGDSRPVSSDEFQRLARAGREQLDRFIANSAPIDGLDDNWDAIKSHAFDEALKSWGGSTIDARTGEPLLDGANRYALTVKDGGVSTVSVPENATRSEFNAAMDAAKEKFRSILERENHFLGVFHDDDLNRIDIDPVTVVDTLGEVHAIGAATRAIGGAYCFADGNGYWPPHVRADG